MSNGKLLVPGERGLVGASASAEAGAAPLEAAAWRLIEVEGSWSRGGWVQLRHVLSGAFLRLVPPPHPLQWTFSVDGQPASHASLFQLECDKPPCDGSAPVHLRVHPDATGARLNYRGDAPRRRACYAPCASPADGEESSLRASPAWDDLCADVYAQPVCEAIARRLP
ncbi:hypothetical protein EMIHUDRAFT_456303 [Emiliania huxleyi CCMP1516]|uniref:Uncharacterized protein n=2 Tax=Emiliania huxleyi TaxID=2903 RepID=A0A0D3K6S8_EMIH1|nr:hypothetical protein EMIHUDRAFT_456303 [Emiliania huxleyi CCMP1516]EOD31463.1 hypothetical protein EMIHUDRAFT_456303 [Emiliania huxleyi CCMP1516]|eukprot:XP_005783892.1 hypothetical protein EMIHUDRAFT_456303 [Emiliania huxleyi CCMP1516]